MADSATDNAQATWSAPQCHFSIEYSIRALDDIRLTVMDAFFSLPRGGVEIGGILLGRHEPGRVVISGYVALDCEHASGPSFALSGNDEARLAEMLAARGNVVGWYHSHTRSEIFLSDADLEIYRRFFPEPWQVALVMKPHTFLPMRMGFFFRQPDGSVHASAACQEVTLEALPIGPVPAKGAPPQAPQPMLGRLPSDSKGQRGPVIDLAPLPTDVAPGPRPAAAPPTPVEPPAPRFAAAREPKTPIAPPAFLTAQPEPSRRWLGVLAIGIGLAAGAAGFQTRALWLPRVVSAVRPTSEVLPPSLGLNTMDAGGQLQIRWNTSSLPVRNAADAILEIIDGPLPQFVPIDRAQLQAGVFTYARQGEQVEVKLTVRLPEGRSVREAASFLGKLPAAEHDELSRQAAKLKSDLDAQGERTRKLEKSLGEMQKTLQEQQLKRLQNQAPQD